MLFNSKLNQKEVLSLKKTATKSSDNEKLGIIIINPQNDYVEIVEKEIKGPISPKKWKFFPQKKKPNRSTQDSEMNKLKMKDMTECNRKIIRFVHELRHSITEIAVFIDLYPHQHISFAKNWVDTSKNIKLNSFELIDVERIVSGRYIFTPDPEAGNIFASQLKKQNANIFFWPTNCCQETKGAEINYSIEYILSNWEIINDRTVTKHIISKNTIQQNSSIFPKELSNNPPQMDILTQFDLCDRIMILGGTRDYRLYHSLRDILKFHPESLNKITILDDSMGEIGCDHLQTKKVNEFFAHLKKTSKIQFETSEKALASLKKNT